MSSREVFEGNEFEKDYPVPTGTSPNTLESYLPDDYFEMKDHRKLKDDFEKSKKQFQELLNSIISLDSKVKILWAEIYENAIFDRMNAYLMFADLYKISCGKPDMHSIHGLNLTKYLERMEKANTQLIKLAELVDKAKEKDESSTNISAKDLFKAIKSNSAIKADEKVK